MSEQQPLLGDAEANVECREEKSWKGRTARTLESRHLHKAVIALITIDAVCVLADLSYTFLSEDCRSSTEEEPQWLEVLAHISLAITTFFLIEIPLTLFAFGPQFYNPVTGVPHASLHLFDALIILVTFVLEVVLKGRERELAGLLIVLRLWRLVKLVGGVAVGAGELNEELSVELADTKSRLDEHVVALTKARAENSELRARLSALEGDHTS
ncbi:hypothetical protein BD410DRAFT_782469 [Rickenella mellea]|uniref:Voltage-gated hydrogen channel 1 n=1 Tax=Rickenella mellea TaxID=50990 RepID=A0A4Y7QJW6_9AGAM|nr:hypothetical protein BD410DRAFT_782469 [Rickenella mellea]